MSAYKVVVPIVRSTSRDPTNTKLNKELPPTPPASVTDSPDKDKKYSPTSSRNASPSFVEAAQAQVMRQYEEEGPITAGAGGKSLQLNPRSSSFKPVSTSQEGTPDLSSLSLKDRDVGDAKVSASDDGPVTPTKKKDAWAVHETPRRSTHTRDTASPTPGMSYSLTPPSTGHATQPVTPFTPAQIVGKPTTEGGKEEAFKKINSVFSAAEETVDNVGRYLLIRNFPRDTKEIHVRDMIQALAEFRAIIVKHLRTKGCVVVVFYDPRETFKVYEKLHTSSVSLFSQGPLLQLHCMKVQKDFVHSLLGRKQEWGQIATQSESSVKVQINGGIGVSQAAMHGCLTSIGPLQRLDPVGHDGRIFLAEFYDTRDAAQAINLLNEQRAGEALLRVSYLISEMTRSQSAPTATGYTLGSAAYTAGSLAPGNMTGRSRPSSSVSSDLFGYPPSTEGSQSSQLNTPSTSSFGYRRSEQDLFGTRTPSSSYSLGRQSAAHSNRYPTPHSLDRASVAGSQSGYETPARLLALSRRLNEPGTVEGLANSADIEARARQHQGLGGHWNMNDRKAIPGHNRVFPERILSGLDSRTTVMIKDVPNKLSRQELVDILAETVPRDFDFVYLRFDFKNCCNVGYAFVNFCSVKALYQFIQARVGKKWNMFSSEKVLQVSYADIQGKAALINKFRNSAVMGVIEPWRPQIFYSSGAMKGLPEPFPDSDNLAVRQKSTAAQLSGFSSPSSLSLGYEDNHYYDYPSSLDSTYGL